MSITIPIESINLCPGNTIAIHSLTWQKCERILDQLGEDRHTRIAYYQGILEIMSPLSQHERPHYITADIVKAILDAQGRDWEDFGSTTFYHRGSAGVEPDTCLYVDHAAMVRDCKGRIDVEVYPPPDLAIESDVTSKTLISAYESIAVPEVWVLGNRHLQIFLLEDHGYVESTQSRLFPTIAIHTLVPQLIQNALEIGTSAMMRKTRANKNWI